MLNVVHETDRHLARIFEAVRRAGLEQDTLIVVTGDHGQAFGYPHDTYVQGRTVRRGRSRAADDVYPRSTGDRSRAGGR